MTSEKTTAAPETLLASPDQVSQAEITEEIRSIHADAAARVAAGENVPSTLYDFRPYRSSILRHPTKNPKLVDPETIELHFALGSLFRRRGEYDRAVRMHQNLLERPGLADEQKVIALAELGQDYLKAGILDRRHHRRFGRMAVDRDHA